MKQSKYALVKSVLALILCVSMLAGTTYAWFTDTVSSQRNQIMAGTLNVGLEYLNDEGDWEDIQDKTEILDKEAIWEPGYTDVVYLKVSNEGSLALKYQLGVNILSESTSINKAGAQFKLSDYIHFGVVEGVSVPYTTREDARNAVSESKVISAGYLKNGNILANGAEQYVALVVYMPEEIGNEANYAEGKNPPTIDLGINLVATQCSEEEDSFGSEYDELSQFPVINLNFITSAAVTTTNEGKVESPVVLASLDGDITATVPAGVQLKNGVTEITFSLKGIDDSTAEISLEKNEISKSVDVHIEGISEDNTVPILVTVKEMMPKGLNIGNYKFYHVEDDGTKLMTLVDVPSAHNEFSYDPATGDVTMMLQSFSEVAMVADTENAWEGNYDYSWYSNVKTIGEDASSDEYKIANADQLAAFGAIVGGMSSSYAQDSFPSKTVNLISDIDLGDKENAKEGLIFYPIGYYYNGNSSAPSSTVYSFEGTFDGNGHTVSNFYQNTWEIKGDYDGNYYKDGMGLFGYVANGTVKNLTVDNFSSDGEFTPTGVITAYAVNSTFENIAITNCNPRVYNTGNGGIIGIAGRENEAVEAITLKNITVDNTNIISALWGSWDVACGGLVGMYRGNVDSNGIATGDTISFENCHVSAQIDVYNDVCANYQYYAYRYAGMIIGSVRHNTKNDAGKTIPNMTGISASGCTVNYGDWNDYYYCEFEKNTMASYSEDYQFSRVDKSEIIFDENCKAIGCIHTHTDAEDKRAVYLPFHQLFTGYSWGVSSIGLKEYSGIVTDLEISEGEQEKSVEKFEGKVTELANEQYHSLGNIFSFVDKGVELKPEALTVTITNLEEDNPVSAKIAYSDENWEQGTIYFTGTGKIKITIQDYYFCTPTTITVNITDRQPEEKFDVVMNNGDFLHRVGNSGTVALDKLFKAKDGVNVGTVSVTVEKVNGSSASGTYSDNAIQFNGTGVVKVTIKDDDTYCIPNVLYLEVVDATNLTSATGTTTGGNFVLLSDVNTSTYVNYWNCTLYGNGFKYSLKGAPITYNSKQGHGVIITKNATLDNLVIVGDIYDSYGAYTNQDYYNTAVDVVSDTTIQNCYIANCAAPVKARGNVTIKSSTLYGGTVANLIIMSGTSTLENVTTANYDDDRKLIGMGIVIHSDATETAKLVLNGTLTQYNFINEGKVPTDTYAENLHNAMFNSNCSQYQFGTSPNRYVNTGIISLTGTFNGEDIIDNAKTGYVGKSLSVSSYDGYVYTQPNTSGSVNNNYTEYKPTTQGAVPPSYSFDYTNKNYIAKTEGSNDYCYEENGKVNISMDDGETFNWDTSILTIGKGITNYTVSMNGTDYTGKSIAFNTAGDYNVTYTYKDDNNCKLDENGDITTYSVTYTQTVNITVAVVKATTKHAEFTFGSSNTASTTVTVGNNTYVMPNVSGTSSTIGSTTVDGKTIYYPIVEIIMSDGKTSHKSGWYAYFPVFSGAVTITDYSNNGTGDRMTPYNGSTTTMPSGLSVVGDATQLFKYQSSSAAGSTPVVKSNILVYSSATIEAKRSEYSTVIQYSYTDNAGATYYYYIGYHAPAQSYSSCVTPDTLVTLADGTQKEIQYVTYEDKLLVWDFNEGKYTVMPSSIVMNHGYDNYQIVTLEFEDGTVVDTINGHGFFDKEENKFVILSANNVKDYLGHKFVKQDGNGYITTKLVGYSIREEYTESWSVLTAEHYNCILEGMLTLTPAEVEGSPDYLMPFEINDNMKYNKIKKWLDVQKYGLYTYEEFSDYVTEEQFEALGLAEFKVSVGKGYITYDEILSLLNLHMGK